MKKPTVFVGVPIHRQWTHESLDWFEKQARGEKDYELATIYKLFEESLIQRARNKILQSFLTTNYDYLFFIDDDIVLFNDAIGLLIKANKDIIGGAYICKKPPHTPTFMPYDKEYPDLREIKEPVEVRYASTGCLLLSRSVCERVSKKYKFPFDCFPINLPHFGETYLSEDWGFCQRAKDFKMWSYIHPQVILGHLGIYAYGMNDFYYFREQQNKQKAV